MSPETRFRNRVVLFLLFFSSLAGAQSKTTIHILHPWADDSERAVYPPYVISSETGYYPGTPMKAEGGDWYTYTFTKLNRTTNDRVEFASYIPDQYNAYSQAEKYPSGQQIIFLTLFSGTDQNVNEVWLTPAANGGTPKARFTPPPGAKVIAVLNPWDLGAPRIRINDYGTVTMYSDKRTGRCGWFLYNYYGETDSAAVFFVNSLDATTFGRSGVGSSGRIDATAGLSESDTVWIHIAPASDTVVVTTVTWPGIEGDCATTISLAALMRDIGIHPDFGIYDELAADSCGDLQTGMVQKKLGPDGKPVKKEHRCKNLASQFDWFETQTFDNGYTNETCYNLTLTKNDEGLYAFATDSFYPLDDFVWLDDAQTVRNPNNNLYIDPNDKPPFNIHFTMELSAQFEYRKGQTFYFRGDDDVWVFIDSQLVVDLGGDHGPIAGSVNLDTLGLSPGTTYSFKLFFVERNCCGSNFMMQTSLNLRTESRLFTVMTIPQPGQVQFSFFERISRSSLACDASELTDTIDATAEFFIDGPQFPESLELPPGLSYEGIYIADKRNVITVDTSNITGLKPGAYVITSRLVSDPSQLSKVTFTVVAPPKPPTVQNPVVAAAYYADNGVGQVTRAEVYYTNSLVRLPDSVVLFWPEPILEDKRIAAGAAEITADPLDARHLTIRPAVPFDTSVTRNGGTAQLGTSYIYDTTFADPRDVVRFPLADSVGPLLTYAVFPERKAAEGNDTLLLGFTENVIDSLLSGASLILRRKDGSETVITVVSYAQRFDTAMVIVEPFGTPPAAGDSLRIAAEGPVTDRYGNHAHPLNRPVPLTIRRAAGNVIAAYYSDADADGVIDKITFRFDRAVEREACSFSIAWKSVVIGSAVSSAVLQYENGDSMTVVMDLTAALGDPMPLQTGGLMAYSMTLANPSGDDVEQDGAVADSAAPVVVQAYWHPALLGDDGSAGSPDTLVIHVSEPLRAPLSPTPFTIRKHDGGAVVTPELSLLQQSDTVLTFLVMKPVPDASYPEDDDSVYVNVNALVADIGGAEQKHPLNHRALLVVYEIAPRFRILCGPNPFDPLHEPFNFIIDPGLRSRSSTAFTVQGTIYDKTGSVVFRSEWEGPPATGNKKVVIPWNGTNRNGRYVGSGTYLAFIKIFDATSGKRIAPVTNDGPVLVGVMRK